MSKSTHRHRWVNPVFTYQSRATLHNYPPEGSDYHRCFPERYITNVPTLDHECLCGSTRRIALEGDQTWSYEWVNIQYPQPMKYKTGEFYTGRLDKATPAHVAMVLSHEIEFNMQAELSLKNLEF